MTKKFISMCLAITALAMVLAGCNVRLGEPEPSFTIPTVKFSPEDEALINALNWDGGDTKMLEGELQKMGVLPTGVTLPPPETTITAPALMAEGVATDQAELLRLVRKVQETMKSQTFFLKGNGNNFMEGGAGSYAPLTLAVDKDKLMLETQIDWSNMSANPMTGMPVEGAAPAAAGTGTSKIQAAILQTAVGRTMRMLFVDSTAYMMFPEKKLSANFSKLAAEGEGEGGDVSEVAGEITKMFSQFGANDLPEDKMRATKVTENGNEYMCAAFTVTEDGAAPDGTALPEGTAAITGSSTTTIKYYFLKGELRRLEVIMTGAESTNMVIEVDEFSGKVDSSLFSTKGFTEMNFGEMTNLMGALSF